MDNPNMPNGAGEGSQGSQANMPTKVESHTLLGVLAYLGPLVIVSFLLGKNDPFVKFHVKQALVLFVIEIIVWVLSPMLYMSALMFVLRVLDLAVLVLAIIGIMNVVAHKEKELPFVGQFSKYFSF